LINQLNIYFIENEALVIFYKILFLKKSTKMIFIRWKTYSFINWFFKL